MIININNNTRKIIDVNNGFADILFSKKPSIQFNENDIIRIKLFDSNDDIVAVDETDLFDLGIDTNFIHTDDLCCYSNDFEIVDSENGIIQFNIQTNTVAFEEKVLKEDTKLILQVRQYPAGNPYGVTLVQDTIKGQPSVMDNEGASLLTTPEYFTAVQTTALVNGMSLTDVEVKALYESNDDTNNFSDAEKTKLSNLDINAEPNQDNVTIKTQYEANADTNVFTDSEKTKLAGIEDNAEANQTDTEIKTAYENNSDTNAFTDSYKSKLDGIEDNAEPNQDDATIKTQYENNADTNAFTDALQAKLSGLESSHYKGAYLTLTALETAYPTANSGDYADVDAGAENEVIRYIYDVDDTSWIEQAGASSQMTDTQVKVAYENNADTNAFTDAEKTKLTNTPVSFAPIDAEKNVDITKADIEALLTGEISSHTHADSGGGTGIDWNVVPVTASKTMIANESTKVDLVSGDISLTFPLTVANGDKFPICFSKGMNTLTLVANGHKINMEALDDTSWLAGNSGTFIYDSSNDNFFLEHGIINSISGEITTAITTLNINLINTSTELLSGLANLNEISADTSDLILSLAETPADGLVYQVVVVDDSFSISISGNTNNVMNKDELLTDIQLYSGFSIYWSATKNSYYIYNAIARGV